jgi:hypothetical protein
MRPSARLYLLLAIALLVGNSCDQQAENPATPTPIVVPPPQGEINATSIQPDSGATLDAEVCDGGYCTDDVRFAFDVQLNQDVGEPWLTVRLYDGSRQCAASGFPNIFQTLTPLRANTPARFEVSSLGISETTYGSYCEFPSNTTKMVVQLWPQRGRESLPLLTKEFAYSVKFVRNDSYTHEHGR